MLFDFWGVVVEGLGLLVREMEPVPLERMEEVRLVAQGW